MSRPTLIFTEVAVEPVYVVGFPAYSALTIATDRPNASIAAPWAGWQSSNGMVGVTLMHAGSVRVIHETEPLAVADPAGGVPVTRLDMGASRRMLVDLTEVLPGPLDPGSYDAVIHFGPATTRAVSAPVRLAFRPPTDRERHVLESVADEVAERRSWGQWTFLPPEHRDRLRRAWGPDDPLRFNWVLRELLYGKSKLRDIPLDRVDMLDGLFAPEREALRAELLAARDMPAELVAQVDRVRRDHPGLTYWMDEIVDGASEIAWIRNQEAP